MDFPVASHQFGIILILNNLLDPGRYVAPARGLDTDGLPVPDGQDVNAVPQVYPLAGVRTPSLNYPAPIALVAQIL